MQITQLSAWTLPGRVYGDTEKDVFVVTYYNIYDVNLQIKQRHEISAQIIQRFAKNVMIVQGVSNGS